MNSYKRILFITKLLLLSGVSPADSEVALLDVFNNSDFTLRSDVQKIIGDAPRMLRWLKAVVRINQALKNVPHDTKKVCWQEILAQLRQYEVDSSLKAEINKVQFLEMQAANVSEALTYL